eukprot:COSAG01_NODE_32752_length_573_cov_0.482180_1_plen_24_part_10
MWRGGPRTELMLQSFVWTFFGGAP